MTPTFSRIRKTLPAVALCLASLPTLAMPVNFAFTGAGIAVATPCVDVANCTAVFTVGDADDVGTVVPGSWSSFLEFRVSIPGGAASGSWSFTDLAATGNDLSGSFTAQFSQFTTTAFAGTIDYLVTGGSGMFAGAIGTGRSSISATGGYDYAESGQFNVTAVPEPETYALMLVGAMGLWIERRRRSAQAQRSTAVA